MTYGLCTYLYAYWIKVRIKLCTLPFRSQKLNEWLGHHQRWENILSARLPSVGGTRLLPGRVSKVYQSFGFHTAVRQCYNTFYIKKIKNTSSRFFGFISNLVHFPPFHLLLVQVYIHYQPMSSIATYFSPHTWPNVMHSLIKENIPLQNKKSYKC